MATQNIFELNKEFGTIPNVTMLKGFLFNSTEALPSGKYEFVLTPWRNYLQNPFVTLIGFLLFGIVLLGIFVTIKQRKKQLYAFTALFLFGVTMLLAATPPFSWMDALLRDYVPLFGQVFRFPDTKFSILTSAMYAIFFSFGTTMLISFLGQWTKHTAKIIFAGTTTLLIIFMFPLFTGNLFFSQEQIKIPKDYFALFSFFQHQDPNTRIADLPQPGVWGWQYYTFGYDGSGFLWFGLPQPLMHRAFDVWSNYSENYYFEVSQAIYTKNPKLLSSILQKYQINWLILDKNLRNPSSPTALFVPETESLLKQNPDVTRVKSFGNILVYKVTLHDKPKSFVFTTPTLPTTNAYSWSNEDSTYQELGNYAATTQNPLYVYPFHALFSLKSEKEKDFTMTQTASTIRISQTVIATQQRYISVPKLSDWLAATIKTEVKDNQTKVFLTYATPSLLLDGKPYPKSTLDEPLFVLPKTSKKATMQSNSNSQYIITPKTKTIETTLLSLTQDNVITLVDEKGNKQEALIPASYLQKLPVIAPFTAVIPKGTHTLSVLIPKITDPTLMLEVNAAKNQSQFTKCDSSRGGTVNSAVTQRANGQTLLAMQSLNASGCLAFYKPNLAHRYGYALFVTTQNKKDRPLHMWVENVDEHFVPIDTILSASHSLVTNSLVLSPQDSYGNYYALHFENVSVATDETENLLGNINMYPIPYNFLTKLVMTQNPTETIEKAKTTNLASLSVDHPNESFYAVTLPNATHDETLVLSQAYNPGWQAYTMPTKSVIPNLFRDLFPFFFGQKLTNHQMINNWENGWTLPSQSVIGDSQFVIVYLPQYLQYAGYLLTGLTLLFVMITWLFSKFSKQI